MADAQADNPDVGECDIHHDIAVGVCWVWYNSGDPVKVKAANDYWEANFGETFQSRLRRPL